MFYDNLSLLLVSGRPSTLSLPSFQLNVSLLLYRCWSTTTGVRAITSKTTITTKFEVKKFDGKSNFLLWKMRVTSLLIKEGTHKILLGIEKKPSKMDDDKWNNIDFRAKTMIILSDDVLYNVMNKETLLVSSVGWRAFTWQRVCRTSSSWRSSYAAFGWRKIRLFIISF